MGDTQYAMRPPGSGCMVWLASWMSQQPGVASSGALLVGGLHDERRNLSSSNCNCAWGSTISQCVSACQSAQFMNECVVGVSTLAGRAMAGDFN